MHITSMYNLFTHDWSIRAFSSGVPNAKYLAFGTPITSVQASLGILNVL